MTSPSATRADYQEGQTIRAIAFDLYGTLVRSKPSARKDSLKHTLSVLRGKRRELGTGLPDFVRGQLLKRDLQSYADFDQEYSALLPEDKEERGRFLLELFTLFVQEYQSADYCDSARTIIDYCRQRFDRLYVVSNASAYHKKVYDRLELNKKFDAAIFSCDIGHAKPEKEMYDALRKISEVPFRNMMFVGDSYNVDYVAPRQLGMGAIHVSKSNRAPHSISDIRFLPWQLFGGGEVSLHDLLKERCGLSVTKKDILRIDQKQHNKDNVLYLMEDSMGRKWVTKFHGKRGASFIEAVGYELLSIFNLFNSSCVSIADENVSCIVIPYFGENRSQAVNPAAEAHEIGRLAAFSYLFGNVDFRPRNIVRQAGGLQIVDLEHLFVFAESIERSDGRGDPFSTKAMLRALREFRPIHTSAGSREAFAAGFREVRREARYLSGKVLSALNKRLTETGPILGGLHRHPVLLDEATIEHVRRRILLVDENELLGHLTH